MGGRGVCPGGCLPRDVYPRGVEVSIQGCQPRGCLFTGGRGVCLGVFAQVGVCLGVSADRGQTDTCENIKPSQTSFAGSN